MAFVGGTQSVENRQVGLRTTERLTQGRMSMIEGSHLFPFEQPQATARAVLDWIGSFRDTRPPACCPLPPPPDKRFAPGYSESG